MKRMGIDASLVPAPNGVIQVAGSPIAWVYYVSNGTADWTETISHFAVPDKRLSSLARRVAVESVQVRDFPMFWQVTGLRWQGTDSGLGAIAALNKDVTLKLAVLAEFPGLGHDVTVSAYSSLGGHWDLHVDGLQFFSLAQWKVLEAVASCILTAESTRAAAPSSQWSERVL
jgi:hypothetical protein